jgi:tetratricopeptide (TPR) repeat protein
LKKTDLAKIDLNKAIELDEGDEEAKILSDSLESSLQNETLNCHFNDLKENVQDKAVVAEWTNSEFEEYLKQSNKVNTKLLYDLREEYFQLDENENYPEAIKRLTQIIEYIPVLKGQSLIAYVDPSDMLNGISLDEIYFNRSQLYSKLSLYDNAKNDLIKAVNSNPVRKEPIIHHHLGCTMIQCGDFTSCIEHFNIAIEKDPEYYDSYYMRAVAYSSESSELHDINQARKDLEIYLDKYPEDGAANKLLEIINP